VLVTLTETVQDCLKELLPWRRHASDNLHLDARRVRAGVQVLTTRLLSDNNDNASLPLCLMSWVCFWYL